MSEVKSARELAHEIASSCLDFADPIMVVNTNRTADLIKSDRRAIIEKCKEAIHEEAKLYSPKVVKFDYGYCWAILDSVLSEIEKEK